MLDEAIEYSKTLQLQILSTEAGVYMLPMMLAARMQRTHATHMPHSSTMGIGMGNGMSPPDLNGGTAGVPPIQGPVYQVHFLPIPGSSSFQGTVGSSLRPFGHHGQGLPMPMPRSLLLQLSRSSPLKWGPSVSGMDSS